MAIFVMLIIIVLNIALLIVVMRVGTQGEHHSELSADQSTAVLNLHDRLGLPRPEPKQVAVVHEHAKDVENTVGPVIPDEVQEDVSETVDEVQEAVEDVQEDVADVVEDIQESVSDEDADDSEDDD